MLDVKPSYVIDIEPARALLRMAITGFFDRDMVAKFAADRNAAVERLKCGRNQHVTLCDISGQMISSAEVVEEFKKVVGDPRYASRRLAFVVNNALARLQTQRVATRDNVGYFEDAASAEAWLFDNPEPAGDAAPDRP